VARSAILEKASKYYPIRRSTRLPLEIPLRVTSVDPKVKFAVDCNTVTVNAHGCGLISPKPLAAGTRVTLEIVSDKQSTTARVLDVVPLDDEKTSWLLGMEMEQAGNFWGIKYAPADWAEEEAQAAPSPAPAVKPAAKLSPAYETNPRSRSAKTDVGMQVGCDQRRSLLCSDWDNVPRSCSGKDHNSCR
jgi:PilZ domain